MPIPLRKFREIVFQIIFSLDLNKEVDFSELTLIFDGLTVTKKNLRDAHEKANQVHLHLPEIDAQIEKISYAYDFKRISTVEKNILRLGVFELLFDKGVPPKVAIAEAIRIGRKYGSPEGATFINAILDKVYHGILCLSEESCKLSKESL